ncbi:MAG TPA: PilC/PilY family type IV pilus protein [Candidatus Competibacter sp.]|nr:PilC/PilY family type IV pilus protein [Candidatus Competibacter sp.]
MKKLMTKRRKLAVAVALFSGGLIYYSPSYAALLDIAKLPLFVGSVGVPPNVFVTLDDSGSMDWEFTTVKHWQANFYDFDIGNASTTPTDSFAGSEKRWTGLGANAGDTAYGGATNSVRFSYYYGNSDNMYGGSEPSGTNTGCESGDGNGRTIYKCNPNFTLFRPKHTNVLWDWRIFSSDFNVLYYNPNSTYEPWEAGLTNNANYTNACSNPVSGNTTCINPRDLSATDFLYVVWNDDKGFNTDNTVPNRGSNIDMTNTSNGYIDLWDGYTLYTVKAGATNQIDIQTFETTFCANTTATTTPPRTNDARCYDGTTYRSGRLLVNQVGTTTSLTGSGVQAALGGRTIAEVKQNIANWYQYSRRRSFVAKGALGKVITTFPNFRYGISVLNQWSGAWPDRLFYQMPTAAQPPYDTHNTDLLRKLYGFRWTSSGTPLQAALDRAGKYFQNTLSGKPTPILPAESGGQCQQNFSLLTTDGFWNGTIPSDLGDEDGDGRSGTVADVAYKYYRNDLSSLDNKVLKTKQDLFDTKYMWQHMVTFTIGFGVDGLLKYPPNNGSGWPDEVLPIDENLLKYGDPPNNTEKNTNWGDPTVSGTTPAKIDDMWHAAYNGRGDFISARSPDELVEGLRQALSSIQARVGSAAALSLNPGFITNTTNTRAYLARFNSGDWTGQLLGITMNGDGTFNLTTPLWNTGDPASAFASMSPTTRKIFTRKPDGTGIEFKWDQLDATQQAMLNKNPTTNAADTKGPQRLEFLRGKGVAAGDAVWLKTNAFRERASMLGAIVHSDPFFVDGSDDGTASVVYIGANDGMLHAIDAATGAELFAYIPTAVFKRLNAIPDRNFSYQPTVDGSAVVRKIGNKKILVGTLRGGGQSIFALDVTNPGSFSANDILWEYSDNDLGYTFSKPTIAQMGNGQWAVFIGNGYNNTEDDDLAVAGAQGASATGNAALYILPLKADLKLDTVIKLDTGKGLATSTDSKPNGLATPAVIFNPVEPKTVLAVYAGDLQGNLWKFDLSGSASAIAYNSSNCAAANNCKPLFNAKNADNVVQAITVRPEVDVHPYRGYLVYFGTGKYFEATDNSNLNQPTQSLYAVWDRAWGEVSGDPSLSVAGSLLPQTRAHLLQQTIIAKVPFPAPDNHLFSYVTSAEQINWHPEMTSNPSGTPPATHLGWYLDLKFGNDNLGEKQVTSGRLLDKKIVFNSTIPSSSLCDAGGSSNQFILDAVGGSRFSASAFRHRPLVSITVDGQTISVPVSSIPSLDILSEPIPLVNLETEGTFLTQMGSSGNPSSTELDPALQVVGRQSWRQLSQ